MRLVGLIFVLLWCGCAHTRTDTPTDSPAHHTPDGFRNLYIEEPEKSFFSFLKMRWFGDEKWADHASLADTVPVQRDALKRIIHPSDAQKITWLGHSTFLIQASGITILTDPVFSNRASPVSFAGPERYTPHVVDYEMLPPVDLVVISHNHYDHLDETAIAQLSDEAIFAVPLGIDVWLIEQGVDAERIFAFDWWDAKRLSGVNVTATPSQHWSARGLSDRFKTLWSSWSLHIDNLHIWFAGDTGYNNIQFKEIGSRLAPIDIGLIPIGAYAPRWFMQAYHVNPEEALKIHQDIGASTSIGMHWGTFPLTAEAPLAPVNELERLLSGMSEPRPDFRTMAIGETLLVGKSPSGVGDGLRNR